MAYRDELTGLPSRRAFNGAKLRLESPYAMAGVDIDHFKSVNDTFGHDIGDEVLCLVASRLARVTGGGQAFRVGGEEFTILFPGKTAEEVLPDLEDLRAAIEASIFRLRGADRRAKPRGSDRRTGGKKSTRPRAYSSAAGELRVTVSIGVAEPAAEGASVEDVIRLSDQALYRAKKGGRNRIELAGEERSRARRRRKLSSSQD
jgi:GGDEF domain-containing protein